MNKNYLITDSINKEINKVKVDILQETTGLQWENLNYTMSSRGNKWSLFYNRVIKAFVCALKIFLKRKQINNMIFWQQFFGLIFAFYCTFFNVKKTFKVIIVTFIYKKKNGILGKLYYRFIKYIISGKYVDKIICFSSSECDYYSNLFDVDKQKFKFVYLGIRDEAHKYKHIATENEEEFILAVGKSNRDYQFLVNSLNSSKYKVKILCNALNIEHDTNIKIYNNVFGDEYLKLLKKCFAVVIPLKDENISSGQLVILQAMMLEKPIIITKANTIKDYVKDDYNAIIIEKDKNELIKAIENLKNDEFYNRMIKNGRERFIDKHIERKMYEKLGMEILNI